MDYYDLGTYRREINTASKDAQRWFNRGLIWTYAYNHEEAIACFEKALEFDPECVMAHWGIAYAVGPNYNKPWEAFEPEEKPEALAKARAALAAASEASRQSSPVERALLKALKTRYPEEGEVEDFSPFNDAYAKEMRLVHGSFPGDLDLSALFAEAIMNRTPWQLWDLSTGAPAKGADTTEAIRVLDTAFETLKGAWDHPGLLHMYIHLMEMSPHPERALRHGDRLVSLVPDAGHLIHMPTHIDVLCGDYENVVQRNARAIEADFIYLQQEGPDNFYTLYRCHNFHFKIYGAMFLGQMKTALTTADELIENLPESVVRPLADWFEGFIPMKQHVLVRFGQWGAILEQTLPGDPDLFCVTTAMMHYARTVALANTDQISAAEAERDLFLAARDRVPETRMVFNNTCVDILKVAEQMMLGELEYHKGNHEVAFGHLRKSVEIDDALPYDEPWGWMQPTRHALGALLMEQEQFDEAEAVYRADLGLDATLARACQHPGNVWSLHGLHECLTRRGEEAERLHIKLQLDKAQARAEVPVHASCFCRRSKAA
ncbi:tetratricopeptide repeat protein [Hoeflea prorocentri]|uniref:Tetratricopeptide repeat protein n=1 Tax=Hoeflea prorocentri TaxID=1922333 RepID=A0A9X3ZJE5_9HYPH|nr:tetratricopeptide repeat protein [Hoeflea prorocentri]MCY6382876.1 tetratricopeptide repeat protein [Hoeflea prorocentri]MDA5400676.1 tetratricopeptide repeat protein [Hoeflea prorocentri]